MNDREEAEWALENYINGNISTFKKWLKTASKFQTLLLYDLWLARGTLSPLTFQKYLKEVENP